MKDWDAILRGIPTPDSSDAEDDVNVMSVKKHAKRVVEMLHGSVPGLDPKYAGAAPEGMNRYDVIQSSFAKAAQAEQAATARIAKEAHEDKETAQAEEAEANKGTAADASRAAEGS